MIGTFISFDDEGIRRCRRTRRPALRSALALLLVTLAGPVAAVGPNNALNDTGVTTYGNASSYGLTSEPADYPGQDARIGRDAAAVAGKLPKAGAGSKGFDFTKIANNGAVLPASAVLGAGASDWACTYDNVTGLQWEVKLNDAIHLRNQTWSYTWYDSNAATNGGSVGTASGGTCKTVGRCDTEKFVQDVNAVGLCGHGDWRMPTIKELESIVDYGRSNPTIDSSWFPYTPWSIFWSASAYADGSYGSRAWVVSFGVGYAAGGERTVGGYQVRLVRAGK